MVLVSDITFLSAPLPLFITFLIPQLINKRLKDTIDKQQKSLAKRVGPGKSLDIKSLLKVRFIFLSREIEMCYFLSGDSTYTIDKHYLSGTVLVTSKQVAQLTCKVHN